MLKVKLTLIGIVIIAIIAAALYLRYGGITHERICEVVVDESDEIQSKIDDRYQALDQKLDRIEGKLDQLLKIANRPLPDNLQVVQ